MKIMKNTFKSVKKKLGLKKKGNKTNSAVAVEVTGAGNGSSDKSAGNVDRTDKTTNKKAINSDIKEETTRAGANHISDEQTQNKTLSKNRKTKEKPKDGGIANGESRQVIVTKGSKEGAVEVMTEESNTKTEKKERDVLIGKDVANTNAVENPGFGNQAFQDTPEIVESYSKIPIIELTDLPRGGLSLDTKAVGRVQFGIPPETIKDSMSLGMQVPKVYIVPVERFCREMGPALGVNLAEFEFPAYFNFFVNKSKCMLVVDSDDAEDNIRRVFSETLLGPIQFRRKENPLTHEESDFAPTFDRNAIPNMQKELEHFRMMPDGSELALETLLEFCHFDLPPDEHNNLGVPPPSKDEQGQAVDHQSFVSEEEILDGASDDEEEMSVVQMTAEGVEKRREEKSWSYSRARFTGDVASVYPSGTTDEQKHKGGIPHVEIFKMPGGTEYILHDIDENNFIIGKARFSGHVKVKESIGVIGYEEGNEEAKKTQRGGRTAVSRESFVLQTIMPKRDVPRAFYPPSFGVTVLGNSHGFDKSGSVSGYVLWINGRGIMIDPPPYSSATLEREGIRPRMIVGIILTHCHADHDAGAFQKVLTGSQVVVITTPTIYKSFIRKYAALSALSPALLRHCHRYKAAIIGQKLRFQGASFEFIYTLHAIPCIGFKVTWRRRSMVFTGDHLNHPVTIDKLQYRGILSKARADDLRNLPLQDTDLLLHEAGTPPIHTPLDVLMKLPERIKKRMYIVHTSNLPEGCELRVAPTGTAGTIRLDQMDKSKAMLENYGDSTTDASDNSAEEMFQWHDANNEYDHRDSQSASSSPDDDLLMATSFANLAYDSNEKDKISNDGIVNSLTNSGANFLENKLPLVSLRPASSSDAWFTLNLLSAVPFLSSLSYASTMEVLETARVDTFYPGEIVVHADMRPTTVCVVWEGTCAERPKITGASSKAKPTFGAGLFAIGENKDDVFDDEDEAVWYSGDWTAPIALQPEKDLSSDNHLNSTHDVVAVSKEGVKVITIDFGSLDIILRNGSPLYSKYLERTAQQTALKSSGTSSDEDREEQQSTTEILLSEALKNLNILDLLNCNSAFRKLSAVQKRHLECLAEGPVSFLPGERIWRTGQPVEKAFIIVSGTASFVPKRKNTSVVFHRKSGTQRSDDGDTPKLSTLENSQIEPKDSSIGDDMMINAIKAIKELGSNQRLQEDLSIDSSLVDDRKEKEDEKKKKGMHIHFDQGAAAVANENPEYAKVSRDLQRQADKMFKAENMENNSITSSLESSDQQGESDFSFGGDSLTECSRDRDHRGSLKRRKSSKARFANKVLGRLYSRRAFTGGLVFSRGHFLGDISKMVAGLLSADATYGIEDESAPSYGFGEQSSYGRRPDDGMSVNLAELVIHENQGDQQVMHSSTLTAGKDGCVVLVFNRSLIPFLDEYPGLLLSLLGTQVIV